MSTLVFPLLYCPDPIGHDQMTIGVIAVSEDGQLAHALVSDWGIVAAFGKESDREINDTKRYALDFVSNEKWTYDGLTRFFKKSSYPTTIRLGQPAVSIEGIDKAFDRIKRRWLRF